MTLPKAAHFAKVATEAMSPLAVAPAPSTLEASRSFAQNFDTAVDYNQTLTV